jgi:hypothetical protein
MASRETLGELLAQLSAQPRQHELRIRAAQAALQLCFHKGDPHFADVAESLVADAPRRFPKAARAELDKLAAQACATRRAVAMAHRHRHDAPGSLGESLVVDPEQLAAEVERRLEAGQVGLARAVLEVGLARHTDHPRLQELKLRNHDRWCYGCDGDDHSEEV